MFHAELSAELAAAWRSSNSSEPDVLDLVMLTS